MYICIEIEGVMMNVISAYAPHMGCEMEYKEDFWSELDEVAESLCLPVWGMTDGTAEGGVITNEIKRIFQRVGEIIDENQKKNRAQNTPLRNSSLDRKRGWKNSI